MASFCAVYNMHLTWSYSITLIKYIGKYLVLRFCVSLWTNLLFVEAYIQPVPFLSIRATSLPTSNLLTHFEVTHIAYDSEEKVSDVNGVQKQLSMLQIELVNSNIKKQQVAGTSHTVSLRGVKQCVKHTPLYGYHCYFCKDLN